MTVWLCCVECVIPGHYLRSGTKKGALCAGASEAWVHQDRLLGFVQPTSLGPTPRVPDEVGLRAGEENMCIYDVPR